MMLTVNLTKTRLTDPQDDGLESCREPFAASSTPAATQRSTIVPPRQRFTFRFTWRVRLRRLSMALVVTNDRWRRSDSPKSSTVSVSSRPSRTLAAALG